MITRFKRGAFISGRPVRPFALSYPNYFCSLNFDSVETLPLLWDIVTQFFSTFRLEILDVYIPSPEEQKDPQLYADNVGRYIAETMGVPYRADVDSRDKAILISLLDEKITWEKALELEAELHPSLRKTTSAKGRTKQSHRGRKDAKHPSLRNTTTIHTK